MIDSPPSREEAAHGASGVSTSSKSARGGRQTPPAFDPSAAEAVRRAFLAREPGRLLGPGHPVGDLLDAPAWELLEEDDGRLRVRAHVADAVRNARGQLFGGFTPAYADLVAVCTVRAGQTVEHRFEGGWIVTLNLRVDYFEPITDRFLMESRVVRRRGATTWVETRFVDEAGELLALSFATLRETGAWGEP